ncbi:MAG: hypothetical protein M3P44_08100 [Actinomycetota bacterium]|nr:hypothetical protein [Actinomycetota bacterium]
MSAADHEARDLRRRIQGEPDARLVTTREELLSAFGYNGSGADVDHPELEPDRVAQAVLAHHGIEADPPLHDAGPSDTVTLRITHRYAIQGALVLAAAAIVVGFVGRPLYAVVLGLAAGAGVALLALRGTWLEHAAPRWIPRGRLLGALVTAVPVVLVGAAVILPLRAHYRHQSDSGGAAELVREADAAIDHNDFAIAKRKLFQAETSAKRPPAIDDVRAHLVVAQVQSIVADAARKDAIYDAAVRAFRTGQRRHAISLMRSIAHWKDADSRAVAFRRGAAG